MKTNGKKILFVFFQNEHLCMEQTVGVWIPADKSRLSSSNVDIRATLVIKDSSKDYAEGARKILLHPKKTILEIAVADTEQWIYWLSCQSTPQLNFYRD